MSDYIKNDYIKKIVKNLIFYNKFKNIKSITCVFFLYNYQNIFWYIFSVIYKKNISETQILEHNIYI